MISTLRKLSLPLAAAGVALLSLAGCDTGKPVASGGNAAVNSSDNSAGGASAVRPVSTGAGNTATGNRIPIGLVASESGALKPWGDDSVKGAQLAVNQFNAAGGVNGKQVQLLIEDSASKPESGKSAAEKLVSEGVLALLGEVASGITAPMAQVGQEKGIPDVAIGATRTDITNTGNDVFRVCYTDAFQGPVMANFAYNELGLRKMALMTDKTQPYSTGLSNAFRATFTKLGGTIVDEQFYETGQTQFTGQLTNLKAKDPEGLFMSGYFNEVGPIARQAKEAGMNVKMLGGDGWDSSQILTTGGDAILGQYFCNHYNNLEKRPVVQQFLAAWKKAYGGVPATTMGALGYDAAMLTCQALKVSKGLDSKDLRDAIANTVAFHGVSGDITLKGYHGNPPKRAIVVQLTPTGQKFVKAYDPQDVVR